MRIIFARHGQTVENRDNISQGQLPGKLNLKGKRQAKKLARRLENERIDVVYCSDLKRCRDTLAPLLKLRDVKVVYTKELREKHNGIFQGKKHEVQNAWKEERKKKFPGKADFRPPGGETFSDLNRRVVRFLKNIMRKERGRHVLFMTHGGPITFMLLHLFGKEPVKYYKRYHSNNAAVSIVHVKEDGKHHARLINCVKHL